jgi:hypothetical protein
VKQPVIFRVVGGTANWAANRDISEQRRSPPKRRNIRRTSTGMKHQCMFYTVVWVHEASDVASMLAVLELEH